MIKIILKKKEVTSTNGTHKKSTTNNKILSFKDQCKESTKQQFDDLNLGKFVDNNLIAVKLNQKIFKKNSRFQIKYVKSLSLIFTNKTIHFSVNVTFSLIKHVLSIEAKISHLYNR